MPFYDLPKRLPNSLTVSGKRYALITPEKSVRQELCVGNDGSYFYYVNAERVTERGLGQRRHFTVHQAKGQRSVHISMKAQSETRTTAAKHDGITIWYNYDDDAWDGRKNVPAGWGRTRYPNFDQDRLAKAIRLLETFLVEMDRVANPAPVAIAPVLTPPVATPPVVVARQTVPPFILKPLREVENWEELLEDE